MFNLQKSIEIKELLTEAVHACSKVRAALYIERMENNEISLVDKILIGNALKSLNEVAGDSHVISLRHVLEEEIRRMEGGIGNEKKKLSK